jgi:hypothetical protein
MLEALKAAKSILVGMNFQPHSKIMKQIKEVVEKAEPKQ